MKKTLAVLTLTCSLFASSASAGVLITGFGTGQFTTTWSDFTDTQTATSYQIVGSDDGDSIYGELPTSLDISGSNLKLTLTATLTSVAASNFQIALFDVDGNERLYQGNFSAFTIGVETTVTLNFYSQVGAFDNDVVSIGLLTAGVGSPINLTMNELTAIPEASSIALLGMGLSGLLVLRRRR